jgi:predicted Zn-dependent protease
LTAGHERVLIAPMQTLEDADSERIQAADGWVKLGVLSEAEAELGAMSAAAREHPEALQICWLIASKRADWARALELAGRLVVVAPERRFGWLHLAESLHRLERTAEAYDRLSTAARDLEPNATVPLQLARYACRLNRLDDGRRWLHLALAVAAGTGHLERVRSRVLDDPELVALRGELTATETE